MRKKLISIVLSFMLIFNFMSLEYASANEATEILKTVVVDGAAIGGAALGGAVALLAVLGVYVASQNDGVRKAAVDLYNYCDAQNKAILADFSGTIVRVPSSLYETAKHFTDSTYTLGNALRRATNFHIGADGVVKSLSISQSYTFPSTGANIISTDGTHVTFFSGADFTVDYSEKTKNLPVSIVPADSYPYVWGQSVVDGVLVNRIGFFYYYDVIDSTGVRVGVQQCIINENIPVGVAIPGVVPVPALEEADYYDYTRTGVSVPVPQTASGDRVIAIPQTLGLEGAQDITGEMCVPIANTIPAEIAQDIVTYPEAPLPEDETPPDRLPKIDYPKMSVPPKLGLTRKFPFSVPWDLKNAVTALVAEQKCPKWEINFDSTYFVGGGKTTIDFERFETWAKIIRWGVLILFNFGLIKATRKLIGAGG